ncbi:MlaD family protein [Cyanobacterium sp. IPPAS B-1200]|uniref:MlaD family protein n=1 Tax=Cyanobacterium sp. IPPAS B-1200 TaxID=1562720 RepID=UPI0008525B6C|nr:MlaD family protein [Cyanobacterium sp. IPPAS B-1200]OEJ79761.1 mammalian cell entry protein [Cyanobacterium sp. IPPAS B-1200]
MASSRLVREGSLGLFIILGFVVFGGAIFFLRGTQFRQQKYEVKLQFDNAGGLREGGRVLYRGVEVGTIESITPSTQGVEVITQVDQDLRIPKNVVAQTTQSGLLGEVIVTIVPEEQLSATALEIDPTSPECQQQQELLCSGDSIPGEYSGDLIANMTRLSTVFAEPVFINQLNDAIVNIAIASENVAELSSELSEFTRNAGDDINKLSSVADSIMTTSESFNTAANSATSQINRLANDFSQTNREINQLVRNTNQLIESNESNLNSTIATLTDTTQEVATLVRNANAVVTKVDQTVDSIDVVKFGQDIETTIANLEQVTTNLTALSQELNNPTNLVALQQTLDSARVTFANTAKITSDIDELTGDPQFRLNMRLLIDGLSNLVSYTDVLEKQIELAQLLNQIEELNQNQSQNSPTRTFNVTNGQLPKIMSSNTNESLNNVNLKNIDKK